MDGLRYTDEETMDVVQQVLCGKVNKNLVATLNRLGRARAIGLCGMDAGLFQARSWTKSTAWWAEITQVDPRPVTDAPGRMAISPWSPPWPRAWTPRPPTTSTPTPPPPSWRWPWGGEAHPPHRHAGPAAGSGDEDTLIPVVELSQVPGLVKDGVIQGRHDPQGGLLRGGGPLPG